MKKISILLTITALIVMSIIFFASCDSPVVENLPNILADATTGGGGAAGGGGATGGGSGSGSGGATGGAGQGSNQQVAAAGQGQANQPAAVPTTQQVLDVRAALTAIETFIGPKGATGNTLEEDAIALVPLLPATGIAALDLNDVFEKIYSLANIPGHHSYPPPRGLPNNPVGRIRGLEALVVDAALAADAVALDRSNDQASQDLVAAVELIEIIVLGPLRHFQGGAVNRVPPPGTSDGIEYGAAAVATITVYGGIRENRHDQMETDTSIVTLASFRNRLLGGPDIAPSAGGGAGSGNIAGEVASGGSQQSLPAGTPTGITALTAAALALANAM